MNLAKPPAQYDVRDQASLRDELARADADNLKRGRDIEIGAGAGRGRVVLTAPNGSRYALTVSNGGTLSATAL